MKPLGSVGVHVLPPSNDALTAHPKLKFQSLAPVRRFLALRGFAAIGVSFCAVVSRLTSSVNTDGAGLRAKLGRAAGVTGDSPQARSDRPTMENARRTMLARIGRLRHGGRGNMPPGERAASVSGRDTHHFGLALESDAESCLP